MTMYLYTIESSTLLSTDLTGDDGSKLDRAGTMIVAMIDRR
jgi:hypothetical protein